MSLYVTAYSCDGSSGGGSLPASRAPVWLRWLVELDNPFTEANRSELIIRNLDLQPGDDHLDIGCGPGRLTIPVAQQVGPQGAVVAIDLQAGMLRRAGTSSSVEFEQTFGLFRLEWAAADWKSVWRTALCLSPMAHHRMRRMVP